MISLYPYQNSAVDQLSVGYKNAHRQLLVMPTGSGKSVCFAEIIRRSVLKGTVVLLLTDRKELHKQAVNTVKQHQIPVCEITANHKVIFKDATLYIGMVETVARRIDQIKQIPIGLIVVDEAHKANFFKIFDALPTVRSLGCTATPINKKLHLYYQSIVQPIDIPELIEKKFLAPCKAFMMKDNFDDLEVKGGEYTDTSLFKHFSTRKLYAGVLDEYNKKIRGLKTICFCVNVKHTVEMYEVFKGQMLPAYMVHSNMSNSERDYMIKEFENDPSGIMINCGILVAGYDHKPIQAVIVNRKTKSLALWLQMQGRGSRTYRNKEFFYSLDFGENNKELGMWQEARIWELSPPKKKKPKQQPAPVKSCPQCSAIVAARATVCQYCGYKFPEVAKELKEGIMVEILPKTPSALVGKMAKDLSIDDLIELGNSGKWKKSYCWRIIRSMGQDAIREYAIKMNYTQGWVNNQIRDIANSGFRNYVLK